MRGSRFNSQCPCCNDDVCDGFRTREKNAWKKEVEMEDPRFDDVMYMTGFSDGETQLREHIVKLINDHKVVGTAAGFLAVCVCGESFDDYREHMLDLLGQYRENDWT